MSLIQQLTELLVGDCGIMISLRLGSIPDDFDDKTEEIKSILKDISVQLKGTDSIPKALCGLFIDFYPAMESLAEFYDDHTSDRILKAADEITELMRECCE